MNRFTAAVVTPQLIGQDMDFFKTNRNDWRKSDT